MSATLVLPEAPDRPRRRIARNWTGLLLLTPALLTTAFYALALFVLFRKSFEGGADAAITFDHYKRVISEPLYIGTIAVTFKLAFYTTAVSLLLGYPLAYKVVRTSSRTVRSLLILLIAIPFLTNVVVRLYALSLFLANTGLINTLLHRLGILGENDIVPLLRTELGVTIGLVYFVLPFVVLTLIASLQRLDHRLDEAAQSLGASKARAFVLVTLPLSKAGVIGAGILSFTLALSAFSTPLILGGGKVQMIANSVYDQVMFAGNTPLGAALAVISLLVTLGILYVQARIDEASQRREA